MPQIELSDDIYALALRQAKDAGFDTVEAFLSGEIKKESRILNDIESRFTPEVLEELDRIADARGAGGPGFSFDEVKQALSENRTKRKASQS